MIFSRTPIVERGNGNVARTHIYTTTSYTTVHTSDEWSPDDDMSHSDSFDSVQTVRKSPQPRLMQPLRHICLDLPYVPYTDPGEIPEEFEPCEIVFRDRKGDPISAAAALNRVLRHMGCYALAEGAKRPLSADDIQPTMTLALHLPGYDLSLRGIQTKDDGENITINYLAFAIAQETKTYLDLAKAAGRPLRHNGRDIELDKLIMKRLVRVSRDVWQPEFGIWC